MSFSDLEASLNSLAICPRRLSPSLGEAPKSHLFKNTLFTTLKAGFLLFFLFRIVCGNVGFLLFFLFHIVCGNVSVLWIEILRAASSAFLHSFISVIPPNHCGGREEFFC